MGLSFKVLGSLSAVLLVWGSPAVVPTSMTGGVVQGQTVEERKAEADRLLQQGIEQFRVSNFRGALQSWEQALEIYREIGNRKGEANSLGNLGLAYRNLGEYQQAIDYFQQSLTIFQEIGDRQGEGASLGNLGTAYDSLGEYQQAIDYYQQSLTIAREIGNRNGEGNSLMGLGNAYSSLGEYQQAIDYYQQSLTIARAIGDRSGEANSLMNLGNAYRNLGQYQQAIDYYQQSLTIFQEIGYREGEGNSLNNLGLAYRNLGQYQQAIDYYQQSLTIFQEIGNRAGEATTLSNLGKLLKQQNQPQLAIIFLKQSVNITETIRRDIRELDLNLQQSYTESIASRYRTLADLLLSQNRLLEAQQILDLLKIQELENYLSNVRGVEDQAEYLPPEQEINQKYQQLLDRAISIGQELAQLRQTLGQIPLNQQTREQKQRLTELYNQQKQLIRNFNQFTERPDVVALLQQLSPTAQEQIIQPGDLRDLSGNLDQIDPNAVLLYPLILEDRLELLLTAPNTAPIRRTVNVSRAELNQTILDFRQALTNPNSNPLPPAQKLYNWLIKPLENDLTAANAKTLIYSPDAQLRYIPLAALHDGEQWLIERLRVNNITAQSVDDWNTPDQEQLRILAGAFATGKYQFNVGERQFQFSGLPFAGKEVEVLAETVPNTQQVFDGEFNPSIIPQMDNFSVVHLATHAALVRGKPEESFILLGDGSRISLRDVEEDWQFNNIDLIVLSACQTGLGDNLGNGEEILGFGYLMQKAGARAAIASLWSVDDGGTQALMNAFYAALTQGMSKAEALRQAQMALITDDYTTIGGERGLVEVRARVRENVPDAVQSRLGHPYYWAPFILIGNGL
ncbi:MAG: tetratricopeptide repeat protein [Kamptonema sp. SIO4C4]|nr:tetratricopeptide repeat protein [Kamptonema sp. SIO4C4]